MIEYLVEFIGTFTFLSVILTTGQAIPIGLALATSIYFGGHISGGHFNPAVSVMMAVNKKIPYLKLPLYIIAQVLGGLVALVLYSNYKNKYK
jgi:aquaporin Z|tara:strand:+ start:387 stop:662 length:276 start_codon:yes stop_codon:yes gene_type:complete